MNDNDASREDKVGNPLGNSARQVLDQYVSTMPISDSSPEIEANLIEHLIHLQEWLPVLMSPMTHQSQALEFAFYDCFMRNYCAKFLELWGNNERQNVTSPYLAKKLLDDYLKGAQAMERFNWKLSSTSYGAPFSASQSKRAAAAVNVEQTLLNDLLRSILPPEHYRALDDLGINAQEWREQHNAGLARGLKKHSEGINANRETFSEYFRTDHREKSAADTAFIQNLALLWRAGFQAEPTVSHNRDHDTESPFCSFVGAAWKVATGEIGPAADKIRRALKNQQTTAKI